MIYNQQAFWRETMKPARFLIFDARLSVFVLLFLMHMRLWTGLLMVGVALVFWGCERLWGLDFINMLRGTRAFLAGRLRPARGRTAMRQPVDFAFECQPRHRRLLEQRRVAASQKKSTNTKKPSGIRQWLPLPSSGATK